MIKLNGFKYYCGLVLGLGKPTEEQWLSGGREVQKREGRMFSSLFFVHCCDDRSGSSFVLCWLMQFCDLRLKLLHYKANFQCDFFFLWGKKVITFFLFETASSGTLVKNWGEFKKWWYFKNIFWFFFFFLKFILILWGLFLTPGKLGLETWFVLFGSAYWE